MDKPPQNANNNKEKLNKLEAEIEALRLRIGDAMMAKNEAQIDQLRKERLSKIIEYKALGGSKSAVFN